MKTEFATQPVHYVVRRTRSDIVFFLNGYVIAGPWWNDWIDDADKWYEREVERMCERAPA
jgi:hypothetical protein